VEDYQAPVKTKLINLPFGTNLIYNVHPYNMQKAGQAARRNPYPPPLCICMSMFAHAYIHTDSYDKQFHQ
jgi:hypothetical protein